MGKESKQRGENWEVEIEREVALIPGVTLFKVPTAQTHKGKRKYTKKTYVDFAGHTSAGRHIALEAKCTLDSKVFYLSSQLSDFQWQVLTNAGAAGAISFVYLCALWWELRAKGQPLVERFVLPVNGSGEIAGLSDRAPFHFDEFSSRFKVGNGETWFEAWNRLEESGFTD